MSAPLRVMSIAGTRPEAIKLAPVLRALRDDPFFHSVLCVTGQHEHLVPPVLALFGLRPDLTLEVMRPGQDLANLTATLLLQLQPAVRALAPDVVVVHGDTSTTLAGALTAFYERIPLVHVEAGLRSGRLDAPFPEEANRRLADALSDLCCAPTAHNASNLDREGIPPARIVVTGNTIVDAVRAICGRRAAPTRPTVLPHGAPYILVTCHRRENHGRPLARVCEALRALCAVHPHLHVVFPVHPHPCVEGAIRPALAGVPRIHLLPPLEYAPMLAALGGARCALTDSGGLQEEGPTLGVPVLILRDSTERPEGVAAGATELVGTSPERILAAVAAVLARAPTKPPDQNPYGDGRASERIVAAIKRLMG